MDKITGMLTHPISFGILAMIVTYIIMYLQEYYRSKKHPETKKRSINVTIPCTVGAVCWFLASSYMDKGAISTPVTAPAQTGGAVKDSAFVEPDLPVERVETIDSIENDSYHFIRKGDIVIPDVDVFLNVNGF